MRLGTLLFLVACISCAALLCHAQLSYFRRSVLSGTVDDCCTDIESVDEANDKEMTGVLAELAKTRFFRLYKVDLHSECPLWAQQYMCGLSGGCSVCECGDDEIPLPWKVPTTNPADLTLPLNFHKWHDSGDDQWIANQASDSGMTYVDLRRNPEGNTGYSGEDARRIWKYIHEACPQGDKAKMCLEERILVRLMSGFHTSITVQVARNFYNITDRDSGGRATGWHYDPNLAMFDKVIKPREDNIRNLYFSYLFVLRAIYKARDVIRSFNYDVGEQKETLYTKNLVERLLDTSFLSQPTFDETQLFQGEEKEARRHLVNQHFRKISMVMDCVGCEKCRMWSKLQTLGIATALKIMMSDTPLALVNMERNEIIALVNTAQHWGESLEAIREMREMQWMATVSSTISVAAVGLLALTALYMTVLCFRSARKSRPAAATDSRSSPSINGSGSGSGTTVNGTSAAATTDSEDSKTK